MGKNKTCSGHRIASSADLDKTKARLRNEVRHFRWADNQRQIARRACEQARSRRTGRSKEGKETGGSSAHAFSRQLR